jgi:hypothetical protein
MMQSLFCNPIFNLFVMPYRHEILFVATEIMVIEFLHEAIWPITIKQLCVATGPCAMKK